MALCVNAVAFSVCKDGSKVLQREKSEGLYGLWESATRDCGENVEKGVAIHNKKLFSDSWRA